MMKKRQPPPLPDDSLLEIIARSGDVETVIRCAAATKSLRRVILDPGFLRRLRLRAEANGGFNPDLLVAVSYQFRYQNRDEEIRSSPVIVEPPRRLRFDTDLLRSFQPASFRGGLLVLRRNKVDLVVCNTVTGHPTYLPRMDMHMPPLGCSVIQSNIFRPALLSTDGGGCSFEFELLVMCMYRHDHVPDRLHQEIQIFSSRKAEWGAARKFDLPRGECWLDEATSTAPAVIGRTVHWLCRNSTRALSRDLGFLILALHAEAAQATVIKLPQDSIANMGSSVRLTRIPHSLILAATAEGKRLSLVAAEQLVISVWTLLPDEGSSGSWSRQVVIRRQEVGKQLNKALDAYRPIRFDVFGEKSGTVLFWIQDAALVQLNLGTKKALVLWKSGSHDCLGEKAFLHEVDLVSLLQGMKRF